MRPSEKRAACADETRNSDIFHIEFVVYQAQPAINSKHRSVAQ
jgi:hypothetical protein